MALPANLEDVARAYARESRAPATRIAYASDLRDFGGWCECRQRQWLPASPATVAEYLASQADVLTPATLSRRMAAITYVHKARGFPNPIDEQVRAVMSGIRRTRGVTQKQAPPLDADAIRRMIDAMDALGNANRLQRGSNPLDDSPDEAGAAGADCAVRTTGTSSATANYYLRRDRCLILVGFTGALRRSELIGLQVEDIERSERGVTLHIRHSKTDQEGAGQLVAIPNSDSSYSAVAALDAWLALIPPTGPLFHLAVRNVNYVVQKWARAAGIEGNFSSHSLRAGAITTGALRGASLAKLMELSRHRSLSALRLYIRQVDAFKDHALQGAL